MKDLAGKVAFITGGGSGVALGQAKAFAAAGMKIVIADIRRDHLDSAVAWFRDHGLPIHGIQLDITDRRAYASAADEAEATFGPVQLLCNTAGVSQFGPVQNATYDDWDWQMSVNLGGLVNGIQTFVPRMIRHGLGAHIVNTASMAGFLPLPGCAIYCTTKFAVRGLSECLQLDLAPVGIGVSVLCPGAVNTNIHEAVLTRPAHLSNTGYYGADPTIMKSLKEVIAPGYDPVELGEIVVRAVRANQLYVIPYAEFKEPMQQRLDMALAVIPAPQDDPGMAGREAAMAKRRAERAAEAERQRG
ncbi:MAG TPA: SDR family NAD(P)-dependent oxidoreductase [Steroidobacteraceae bacterium]|nr:SDR family NAD(P)-dependent oxidoreductase [Steroidobacteraceae bacterium]